jgi:site-specific DNA recombinase
MGRLMLNILIDFANFEREINVDRAIDSYLKRLQDGINSGAVPYGYKREEKEVVIVSGEAEKVKDMFNLALQGISMNNIARKTGFTNYHVRSILTNPFYCGYIVRKRDKYERRIKESEWKWYKGKHEPIIAEDLWKEVEDLRKSKIKIVTKKSTGIFSHLIYCPYCKHNLCFHSRTTDSGMIFYYQCDRIKMDGKACSQYLREEPLEMVLLNCVNRLFEIRVPIPRREIDIEDKLLDIERRMDKIIKLIEEDYVTFENGTKQLDKLKEEKATVLASKIIELDYPKVAEKVKQIKQIYSFATREEKSRLWRILIERIEAYKDKLVVHWRFGKRQTIQRQKLSKLLKNKSPSRGHIPPAATKAVSELTLLDFLIYALCIIADVRIF